MNTSQLPAGAAQLAEARVAIAQGRLADALVHLEFPGAAGVASDSGDLAASELLRGNIWYERGSYATARAHYERALQHFSGGDEPDVRSATGADAAAANLKLAEVGMARQALRASEAGGLQLILGLVLLAAAIGIAGLAWFSRRRPEPNAG